jgi:hypothetical protein
MDGFMGSLLGTALRMPLWGAQQVAGWMTQPAGERPRTSLLEETVETFWETFTAQIVPLLRPDELARLTVAAATHPFETFRYFLPTRDGVLAWGELANKSEVFGLVPLVPFLIGVPNSPPFQLLELIARSYALGAFPAVWAIEGLGKSYSDFVWNQEGSPPRNLLTSGEALAAPPSSLLMLHAGLGLSLAQRLLTSFDGDPSEEELRRVVREIVALDRDNSRPGDLGAAYESLGLVTRTFQPPLVARVDRILRQDEPDVVGYYWHGVGRALYFLLPGFLPCGSATWRAYEMAMTEPTDELGRDNAVAGLTWGFVLVNQRQPSIVAEMLRDHGAELSLVQDAFSNGVASGMMMRFDTTPDAPFTQEFLDFRPQDAATRVLWDRMVRAPGEIALRVFYPILRQADRLGEMFRYQPLPVLIQRLKESGA